MSEDRTQMGALVAALAEAQKAFPAIHKTKSVRAGRISYSYADLGQVLDAVRPALGKNGLAIMQPLQTGDDGEVYVETLLLHRDGGRVTSRYPVRTPGKTPQDWGSAITYARRYALQSILGVATEDDVDGQVSELAPARTQRSRNERQPPSDGKPADFDDVIAALRAAKTPAEVHAEARPSSWPRGKWRDEAIQVGNVQLRRIADGVVGEDAA